MQHGSTPNYWWAFLAICIFSVSKRGWGQTGSWQQMIPFFNEIFFLPFLSRFVAPQGNHFRQIEPLNHEQKSLDTEGHQHSDREGGRKRKGGTEEKGVERNQEMIVIVIHWQMPNSAHLSVKYYSCCSFQIWILKLSVYSLC